MGSCSRLGCSVKRFSRLKMLEYLCYSFREVECVLSVHRGRKVDSRFENRNIWYIRLTDRKVAMFRWQQMWTQVTNMTARTKNLFWIWRNGRGINQVTHHILSSCFFGDIVVFQKERVIRNLRWGKNPITSLRSARDVVQHANIVVVSEKIDFYN